MKKEANLFYMNQMKEESILDEPTKVKEEIVPVSVKRPKLRSVIKIPREGNVGFRDV